MTAHSAKSNILNLISLVLRVYLGGVFVMPRSTKSSIRVRSHYPWPPTISSLFGRSICSHLPYPWWS